LCTCHAPILPFDAHPVRTGWLQLGKLRCACGPADPRPQHLTHRPEIQILAPLEEIDYRAVVVVIPQREEDIMAIAIALNDDLGGATPQHRASPPALAAVDLIAQTDSKMLQIDLPFENLEFAILASHRNTFSFPIARSSPGSPEPLPVWCANSAGHT